MGLLSFRWLAAVSVDGQGTADARSAAGILAEWTVVEGQAILRRDVTRVAGAAARVHCKRYLIPIGADVVNNGRMSNVLGRTPSRDEGRALPRGETVGRYTAYLDAQKAVDYLADNKFPVERVSIIGNDLKTVERVTGRLSYPRVALASAATGAWFGFFVGLILTLFGDGAAYTSLISSIALGAMFWLLFGIITYAFQRGKRDFTSTSQVIATSYDVIVDPSVAGDARRRLQQLPMNGQSQHPGAAAGGWDQAAGTPVGGVEPPIQPPAPAPVPPAGPGADPAGTGTDPAGPEAPRRGQFRDLPDGRPQYGIRVDSPPAGQSTQEQGPSAAEPRPGQETAPEELAAPERPGGPDEHRAQGQHGSTRVEPPADRQ
jgi:hypothetical protein